MFSVMNWMPLKLSSGTASQQPGQNGRPEAGTRSAGERGAVRHVYFWRKPYFPSTQNVQTGREVLVSFSYPSSQGPGSPGHYMIIVNYYLTLHSFFFFFLPPHPRDVCPSMYIYWWEETLGPAEDTHMHGANSDVAVSFLLCSPLPLSCQ